MGVGYPLSSGSAASAGALPRGVRSLACSGSSRGAKHWKGPHITEDWMGDTFEKRRREQKKRQKKKEKAARKSDRAADKARGDSPSFEVASLEDIVGDLASPEPDEGEDEDPTKEEE